jgi:predicted TPR repeat methyltransferase
METRTAGWQRLYSTGAFKITTDMPSKIAKLGLKNEIVALKRAADLGCGNGRNSIYAASLGYLVDAVDVVDLGFLRGLDPIIRENITFHKKNVMDFAISRHAYSAIIMARLIQYLDADSLRELLRRSARGLRSGGTLMLSYVASGGVFCGGMDVERHIHGIGSVRHMLENSGFSIAQLMDGAKTTVHTNHDLPAETYDIVAKKV